jgi:predicted transcriptional regulator
VIKAMAEAIDKITTLPTERQADATDALGRIAQATQAAYVMTRQERAVVEEGLADLDSGHVVADGKMAEFWGRHQR